MTRVRYFSDDARERDAIVCRPDAAFVVFRVSSLHK